MHPDELLPDYVLGILDPEERALVEEHLVRCARCRAEVQGLDEVIVGAVEGLPPVAPPAHVWRDVVARLDVAEGDARARPAPLAPPAVVDGQGTTTGPSGRPGPGGPSGTPARSHAGGRWARPRLPAAYLPIALALLLIVSGVLGVRAYRTGRQVAVEGRSVATWLARPDVRHQPLRSRGGESVGSVLVLDDGRAMFVLREPAEPGRVYQAWGHSGEELVSLTLSDRPVFTVESRGYDALYLSLEPPGGNPEPTVPLGWIGL